MQKALSEVRPERQTGERHPMAYIDGTTLGVVALAGIAGAICGLAFAVGFGGGSVIGAIFGPIIGAIVGVLFTFPTVGVIYFGHKASKKEYEKYKITGVIEKGILGPKLNAEVINRQRERELHEELSDMIENNWKPAYANAQLLREPFLIEKPFNDEFKALREADDCFRSLTTMAFLKLGLIRDLKRSAGLGLKIGAVMGALTLVGIAAAKSSSGYRDFGRSPNPSSGERWVNTDTGEVFDRDPRND